MWTPIYPIAIEVIQLILLSIFLWRDTRSKVSFSTCAVLLGVVVCMTGDRHLDPRVFKPDLAPCVAYIRAYRMDPSMYMYRTVPFVALDLAGLGLTLSHWYLSTFKLRWCLIMDKFDFFYVYWCFDLKIITFLF